MVNGSFWLTLLLLIVIIMAKDVYVCGLERNFNFRSEHIIQEIEVSQASARLAVATEEDNVYGGPSTKPDNISLEMRSSPENNIANRVTTVNSSAVGVRGKSTWENNFKISSAAPL